MEEINLGWKGKKFAHSKGQEICQVGGKVRASLEVCGEDLQEVQ